MDFEKIQEEFANVVDFVISDVREKLKQINQGPAILDSLRAFAAAVDWTEKWIIGLLVTHAVLLITVLALRKNTTVEATIFFFIMVVVYNAERINGLAARHWRRFATQNYFDPQGIFTSALLSGPLLLVMFTQLIIYLLAASSLLIQMKRKELAYRARQQRKQAAGGKGREAKKDK